MTSSAEELLLGRTRLASTYLRDAVHLDFVRFALTAVEDRLRAQPAFLASLTPPALAAMHRQILEAAAGAATSITQPVLDLRVYLGSTQPRTEEDEASALVKTLRHAVERAVRGALAAAGFPPDPGQEGAERHAVEYAPTPVVLWGWRWLRRLDEVRNRIADAGGHPEIDFDLRWLCPELLALRSAPN
jgi:hypothetical protein